MRKLKYSGYEWLGDIPIAWDVLRVKDGFLQKKSKACIENPIVLSLARDGVKVRDMSNSEGQFASSYYEYNPVEIDDMLINPMDLISGDNCSLSRVEGVISPAYINLRYRQGFNPRFYHYYFKHQYWSMAFFAHGKGVSFENRWTLNNDTLMKYPILVPDYNEQTAIADYLDGKCGEINDLVEKIEKQVVLLEQYKTSVITELLYSDDTICTKLKYIGKFQNGMNYNYKMFGTEVRFLGVGDFKNKDIISNKEDFSIIVFDGLLNDESLLKSGDIVFVRSNGSKSLVGRSVLIGKVDFPLTYSGFCIRFRVEDINYLPHYVLFALKSYKYRDAIDEYTRGTNITNVSQFMLGNINIPKRSISEQIRLIKIIEKKCENIDELIKNKKAELEKLENLKKILIYECITGKKEVTVNSCYVN